MDKIDSQQLLETPSSLFDFLLFERRTTNNQPASEIY